MKHSHRLLTEMLHLTARFIRRYATIAPARPQTVNIVFNTLTAQVLAAPDARKRNASLEVQSDELQEVKVHSNTPLELKMVFRCRCEGVNCSDRVRYGRAILRISLTAINSIQHGRKISRTGHLMMCKNLTVFLVDSPFVRVVRSPFRGSE